jgi:hypothetical protein
MKNQNKDQKKQLAQRRETHLTKNNIAHELVKYTAAQKTLTNIKLH